MKIKLSKNQWEAIGQKSGWNKQAKLMNLLEDEPSRAIEERNKYKHIPVQCRKCHKFATIDEETGQKTFKAYYEMTPKEQREIDNMQKHFYDNVKIEYPHVGECDNCKREQSSK